MIDDDLVANLQRMDLTGLVFRKAAGYDGMG
jgi:hypothetical protein